MSATWHALTSPWGLLCLGLYAAVVAALLLFNHAAHRKPEPEPEFVVRLVNFYPPAVPPRTPTTSWFDGMPVDILSDDAVHNLFDRLIEIEGLER